MHLRILKGCSCFPLDITQTPVPLSFLHAIRLSRLMIAFHLLMDIVHPDDAFPSGLCLEVMNIDKELQLRPSQSRLMRGFFTVL